MIIPVEVRYYNKRYLTPLVGRIALSSRGPFCIICHVGRRTGKPYATLLIAFAASFGFVIALTYGPEGGDTGGYIVAEGTSEQVAGVETSFTGQFLKDILSSAPLTKVYN